MRKLADGSGSERRMDYAFGMMIESLLTFDAAVTRLSCALDDMTSPGVPAKLAEDDSLIITLRDYVSEHDGELFSEETTSPG